MKRCPECKKDYFDDGLLYCLDDGSVLIQGSITDEPATAILSDARISDEGLRPSPYVGRAGGRASSVTFRLPSFLSRERVPWIIAAALALLAAFFAYDYFARHSDSHPLAV